MPAIGIGISPHFQNKRFSFAHYWATQFATAAGITDAGQIAIVKDLCADFVATGLWDKMKAIYPFIGGTADAHKINLKDPRDADDAFRITWAGTITHDGNGIKSNGTDGYGNTHLVPNTELAYDNYSFSVYSRDDSNANASNEIGTGTLRISIYRTTYGGGVFQADTTFDPLALAAYNNSKGLFTVDRVANNSVHYIRNGTVFLSKTDAVTDPHNINPFYICAINTNNSPVGFSSRQIGFACIGDKLTVYEEQLKYAIIRKYINAMDAHSAYSDQILFESWQPATLDQVSLTLKINYGHKIYIDWGEDDPVEITGDGSEVTVTSDYGTGSKTYYVRIYGELTELIKFKLNNEPTVTALNINDFRRLNIPLYELYISAPKTVTINLTYLPRGLTVFHIYLTGLGWYVPSTVSLPAYLMDCEISSLSTINLVVEELPSSIIRLYLTALPGAVGSLLPPNITGYYIYDCKNLTLKISDFNSSATIIYVINSTGSLDIVSGIMKAWKDTIMQLTNNHTTEEVDGFFNAWAEVAEGTATHRAINLGDNNEAASAASAIARTTLTGLNKDITIN